MMVGVKEGFNLVLDHKISFSTSKEVIFFVTFLVKKCYTETNYS